MRLADGLGPAFQQGRIECSLGLANVVGNPCSLRPWRNRQPPMLE